MGVDDPDKGAHDSAQWARKWTTDKYVAKRRANFETVDAYLNQSVGRLLDIGCGFAWDSRWFGEKYGRKLFDRPDGRIFNHHKVAAKEKQGQKVIGSIQ